MGVPVTVGGVGRLAEERERRIQQPYLKLTLPFSMYLYRT